MDIIYLRELRIETVIGLFPWEKATKQLVIFDIELAIDNQKAAQHDNIEDTVDYKLLTKRVKSFVTQSKFNLVETMAEKVAELIMQEFHVPWIKLTLNKKWALRGVQDVGIVIERGKQS